MKNRRTPQGELILPASANLTRTPKYRPDVEAIIREMVERKVSEVMAERETLPLQPWFLSREIANVVRALQTVPERRRGQWFFEDWGCLVCGDRSRIHCALGMCQACYSRTRYRWQASYEKRVKASEAHPARLRLKPLKITDTADPESRVVDAQKQAVDALNPKNEADE